MDAGWSWVTSFKCYANGPDKVPTLPFLDLPLPFLDPPLSFHRL